MFRFTIRDLIWLIVVVALLCDRFRMAHQSAQLEKRNHDLGYTIMRINNAADRAAPDWRDKPGPSEPYP
jgi:hypothetical protein